MSLRQLGWRVALLAALVATIILITFTIGVPNSAQMRGTVAGGGIWPAVAFAAVYALVTLSPLPKTVFTLAAGAIFGIAAGLAVVVVGATVGALGGFGLARLIGRDAVHRIIHRGRGGSDLQRRRLDQLAGLLERRGILAVLIARLAPVVPFTAINYLAGLTVLRVRDFLLGTVLGILPATTAYVTFGAYGAHPGSWPFRAAVGTIVVLTVAALIGGWRGKRTRTTRGLASCSAAGGALESGDAHRDS